MISMEVFMDIFALRRQGFSLRYIAKKLGIHRNTVKKYLENGAPPQYRRQKRAASIPDPFQEVIDGFLEEDSYQATWIFDRISKMGYKGSYDTLKKYAQRFKERLGKVAYIRFETEGGFRGPGGLVRFSGLGAPGHRHRARLCNDPGLFPGHVRGVCGLLNPGELYGLSYPCLSFPKRGPG